MWATAKHLNSACLVPPGCRTVLGQLVWGKAKQFIDHSGAGAWSKSQATNFNTFQSAQTQVHSTKGW